MTTDLVEKCARAVAKVAGHAAWENLSEMCKDDYRTIALAVIDALADGVTIEMGVALERALSDGDGGRDLSGNYKLRALSAAIRAAKS